MKGTAATSVGEGGDVTLVEPNTLNLGTVDWQALELKFNELNALRNAPRSGLNASKARQQQKEQVSGAIESLLEMAQAACRRLLVEGDAKEAVEGGLKTLKLKEAYFSPGSLQLVSSYFHLARTNQYMDRFKAAEEFLSLAQWTILKHPECSISLKAELHQTYGLLYASDGRLDTALKQLAQATYYLTELNGAEHVLTSFGYFDLGNVFAAKANMDCAMGFYDKVKDIWYKHLTDCFQYQPFDTKPRPQTLLSPEQVGEENLQDALKMLKGIVGLQTERFTQVHPCTGKAELVLGLFNVWIADSTMAQECLGRALEIHKRVYGPQHPTSTAIKGYLTQFKFPMPEHTEHFLNPAKSIDVNQLEREEAAVKIQALQRGRRARTTAKANREREKAATKIQAVHRGKLARDKYKIGSSAAGGLPEKGGLQAKAEQTEEDRAATRIQALQRGRQARKNKVLPKPAEKKKDDEPDAAQDNAAIKIQAMQRGRAARKRADEKRAEKADKGSTAGGADAGGGEAAPTEGQPAEEVGEPAPEDDKVPTEEPAAAEPAPTPGPAEEEAAQADANTAEAEAEAGPATEAEQPQDDPEQ